LKGKEINTAPKIPPAFADLSAEEVSKHVGLFTLRFGRAEGLKNLDTVGKSDPYTKIFFTDYEGQKVHYFKTYTIQDDLNPVWSQDDVTVHYFPGMTLELKIFDEDPGRDEFEGMVRIPLAELFEGVPEGNDFKEVTFPLGIDTKHTRTTSVSRLVSPTGISKSDVKGAVSFSYAYISDATLKTHEEAK